jgi:uncharacterized membrane protein YccC
VTVAAVFSLAVAQALQLRLPFWAVLTAVLVTQASVGRSLKATIDYVIGTLAGVVYGGAIALLFPPSSEVALLVVLAAAVAPLALLAALKPSFAVAPITAVIVLLVPTITHANTLASAIDRVLEVGVGGGTGLLVSFLLFPSRAHALTASAAARTLNEMAQALQALIEGLAAGLDVDSLHCIQDGIGHSLAALNAVAAEAERERSAGIGLNAPTRPLLRTLLRLRHDLIMLGRAALVPLSADLQTQLRSALDRIRLTASSYFRACGAGLADNSSPPPRHGIEAAFENFGSTLEKLRKNGMTRSLTVEEVERLFALGFAFDQMRRNLADLERCGTEWVDLRAAESHNSRSGPNAPAAQN